jgi:Type-IV b secretion system, inner-membrane complex component
MTIGFGDIGPQLRSQNMRFTADGWKSFVEAFQKQQIGELFKGHQIVMTTVPSDTAVILAQGPNKKGIYEWAVQVPVIMTYETNNNRTDHRNAIVTLTIVRVSPDQSPSGIAIKKIVVE